MKKVISIIISVCVLISSVCVGFSAMADTGVNVYFSLYDAGYTMEPTSINVTADLSDEYESVTGYNDSQTEPTILDAIIAAHISLYGESFTFNCSSGWISYAFGQSAYNSTYRQNGASAYSLDTALSDGDYIDFAFYQDTSAYSDAYACFDIRTADIEVGESITLTATAEGYNESYEVVDFSLYNMPVTVNGESVGTLDSNGQITLSFDETGTYKITTATSLNSTPVMAPFCTITVTEKATTTTTTTTTTTAGSSTKTSANTDIPASEDIYTVIVGAANYLADNTDSFTVENAIDYLTLINSGIDTSETDDAFIQSVLDNLKANDGKLVVDGAENIGVYGAVIQILYTLGYDATDFEGYDIVEAFTSMDVTVPAENPYYYRVAIEATMYIDNDNFAKSLCDTFISNYYTMGSGMYYYGYSCDNTAMFITALAYYYDDYQEVVDDALALLETYKVDGGYCYNPTYGTEPNCDSTAMALMAYSAVWDLEKATVAYNDLMTFESDETGVFTYGGEKNLYATKDALLALEYYYAVVLIEEVFGDFESYLTDDETTESTTASEESTTASSDTTTTATAADSSSSVKTNTSKTSPSTGNDAVLATAFSALTIAFACVLMIKKSGR